MIAPVRRERELEAGTRDCRPLVVLGCACATGAFLLIVGREAEASLLLCALALSWVALPGVMLLARYMGATVLPGGRSIHEAPTPLFGGLVVALPLMGALLWRGGAQANSLALAVGLLMVVGLVDDLRGLGASRKILLQAFAAILLWAGGHRFPGLALAPFGILESGPAELLLLVGWVVLVTNAVNLCDGLDGLAGSLCIVACVGLVALGHGGLEVAVLAGALLGFLRFNLPLPRAHVFLGDAGTLPLGVVLAALLLESPRGLDLPIAFGILAVPLGDLFLACARRWLRGKPLFAADQGHVHHLLLRAWKRPWLVLLGLVAFAALQLGVALHFRDLRAFALQVGIWTGLCAYLIARSRDCYGSMVRRRRVLQRVHLVSTYTGRALSLVECREEVRPILDRMAQVLGLSRLRVRDLDLQTVHGGTDDSTEESIACAGGDAHVSYRGAGVDAILDEERRAIVCDLVRRADAVLLRLPAAHPTPVAAASAAEGDCRVVVHFIISGRKDLLRIAPVLESSRERGAFRPILVHTGCRNALEADLRAAGEHLPSVHQIDLDVARVPDASHDALVQERYASLLEVARPALAVVIGTRSAAFACVLAAREERLRAVHLGAGSPGSIARAMAIALSEDYDAGEEILPALEALVAVGSGVR